MKRLIIILSIVGIFSSCKKDKSADAAPEISFDSFVLYKDAAGRDTALDFIFKFNDANGDISYTQTERNAAPCYVDLKDLKIFYEEKRGTDFFLKKIWKTDSIPPCDSVPLQDSVLIDLNSFLPDISATNKNEPLEGIVTNRMDINTIIAFSTTGRFTFYIKDRAGHLSNVVRTPELTIVK
jgi:hypothetical protein